MIIGISGLARSGKDSFFEYSKPYLDSISRKYTRLAFADALKQETDEFLKTNVGISSFTEKNSEKEIIRPFLVTYGTHIRRKLNQNCWIDKIQDSVIKESQSGKVVFITDVRFENEIDWVHKIGGKSLHIKRFNNIAPNEEELKNDPILRSKSNFNIEWKDFCEYQDGNILNLVSEKIQSILNEKV
jgi:hypothetical protein